MPPNGVYSVFKNTVESSMSQTVVPVALRKSPYVTILEKSRNVPNGLLKMCPKLEPQRHFEAACCSGIAISAVVRNVAKGCVFIVFHVLLGSYRAKRNFR